MKTFLDASALLREAQQSTGLSDWGSDQLPQVLALLVDALNQEAALHERGAQAARARLLDVMCSRLKLVEDRKRYPGIATEAIVKPIFVMGLPRAGTTFLHNLLSQDPGNRSPQTWEIMFPSPPPEPGSYAADPRIAQCDAALRAQGFMERELQGIHPFGAERPEECNFMWELSLQSVNFMAFWNVPSYTAQLMKIDFRAIYREHRQMLQHLQHRFRRDRWVLKTPAHNLWLNELLSVYPDACLIQCHRDPAKIIASLASNFVALRKTFSDARLSGDFGMLEAQARGMRNIAAIRAQPEFKDRFVDAHYLDVQADPMGMVRRIYAHFGLPLAPEREAAMKAWLARDVSAHAAGHRHSYALADYGLDYARVDAVLGDYIRDCHVQLER
ncbi:MAG TPA: sulfotransferase [Variovorax sp.]|nr:sulfotransferase [Variovorax sp.]